MKRIAANTLANSNWIDLLGRVMRLIEINWNPSNRQLRQFGVVCLFALPLLGWLWGGGPTVVIAAAAGLLLAVAGMARPKMVKPAFLALTLVAAPVGIVIGEAAMLSIYFGVFLPIGLVFRMMNRDGLQLKFDRRAKTYWQPRKQPRDAASYFRQS